MFSFLFAIVFYTLAITAAVSGNNAAVTAVCTMSVLYFLTAVVFYVLAARLRRIVPIDKRESVQKQIDTSKAFYQPHVRIVDVSIDLVAAGVIASFAPWFAAVYITHTVLMQLIVDRLIHIKRGEWE